ncbi:acetyltransferase (GNAT) family protein [Cricetibacter osteomyelitidis]|uniref:Acetyltransferase (GNAT) family protein n=1 Tax=Cricetibacter osteomyelitidis TaxID=1521931 RepID=A0A4R2T537_9PAST|nr:GNAT family N-acetyltransferase [Cricetibacter osteomyelitidis]TCP95944.1 acetyltransferase (GNAT) family protein [Cricetibacter osteomyelitidis]
MPEFNLCLLSDIHYIADFDCTELSLNSWLKNQALKNQKSKASRTFVICDEHNRALGYYALASGSVSHEIATSNIRRNMPNPIPVIVLARLAVDYSMQGRHMGVGLLKDAIIRAGNVSEHIGARALLVHALNERAKQFYLYYGFRSSPIDPMILLLKL